MNFFTEMLGGLAHKIHSENPEYVRFQENLREFAVQITLVSAVSACATLIFAAITLATGSLIALGLTGIGVYVSYNSIHVAANIAKISENPSKYFATYGLLSPDLDTKLLKSDLCEGTFGCASFLEGFVDGIDLAIKEIAKDNLKTKKRRH